MQSACALGPATLWHMCMGTKDTKSDRKYGGISLKEKKDCTKEERARDKRENEHVIQLC